MQLHLVVVLTKSQPLIKCFHLFSDVSIPSLSTDDMEVMMKLNSIDHLLIHLFCEVWVH